MKSMPQEKMDQSLPATEVEAEQGHKSKMQRIAGWCGKLAAFSAIGAASGLAAMSVIPTEAQMGPHDSNITLTLDHNATFDIGPVAIEKPLKSILPFGANIDINGISVSDSGLNSIDSSDQQSLENYARRFSTFENDINTAKINLLHTWAMLSLVSSGLAYSIYRLPGPDRRHYLYNSYLEPTFHSRAVRALSGMLVLTSVLALDVNSQAQISSEPVSKDYDGTVLEGTYIKGSLARTIVNEYGAPIVEYITNNDRFYDIVSSNLRTESENTRLLNPADGFPIGLFFTDLHCNVGMARIIGEFANQEKVDFILNGGDTAMAGTEYENFCIQILGRAIHDFENVAVVGNHDDPEVTKLQLQKQGVEVLTGAVTKIQGLNILGDSDAMRSAFGTGIEQAGDETTEQLGERIADIACTSDPKVNILLMHDPGAAAETIARGCVQTILGGHTHNEEINRFNSNYGLGFQLTGDNISGALKDRPSLGPVESPATMYAIKFNATTGAAYAYQSLTINPDASAKISEITFIPLVE